MNSTVNTTYDFFRKTTAVFPCNMTSNHFHNEHELYILIDGHTKYFVENELIFLNPGEMIFIPKGTFHKTSSEAERILLMFDDAFIGNDFASYTEELSKNKHIIIKSKHLNKIEEILHKIEKESEKKEKGWDSMQRLYLKELLILISRYRSNVKSHAFTHSYTTIQDIAKFISTNYTEDLSLKRLSAEFSISPNHLSKQFKKITEIGISDYINITRISAAEKLLRNSDYSITEIATMCGFNDSNYFAAVFKKIKGITPKKYALLNRS